MLEKKPMHAPEPPELSMTTESGVCVIEIDRGPVNALPLSSWNGIRDTFATVDEDLSKRAVVLHGGEGRFCAGADIKELVTPSPEADDAAMLIAVREAANAIHSCRIPVVAAIDGPAHGGGLELALACDLRVASERATFAASGVNMGLIAGIGSIIDAAGDSIARRMLLSGERIDATTALQWNLITAVVDAPIGSAHDLAKAIAQKPPLAVEAAKAALNNTSTQAPAEEQSALTDTFRRLANTADHHEAINAFLEKRPANFTRE